jgi:hypothetical protein
MAEDRLPEKCEMLYSPVTTMTVMYKRTKGREKILASGDPFEPMNEVMSSTTGHTGADVRKYWWDCVEEWTAKGATYSHANKEKGK